MIQAKGACMAVSEETRMIPVPVEGGEEGEMEMKPQTVHTAKIEFSTPAGMGIVNLNMPEQLCTIGGEYQIQVTPQS